MQTNAFAMGSNKVMVVSGVRKLSDSAGGIIIEFSPIWASNSGFGLFAPASAAANFGFSSRGSSGGGSAISATSFAAPISAIATGLGDVAAPQSLLRINGVQAAVNTATQGAGNYGTFQLNLFFRAGTSLFFNGNFYGAIIRGAQSSAQEITNAENWMTAKTTLTFTEFDRSYKNKTATVYGALTKTTAI